MNDIKGRVVDQRWFTRPVYSGAALTARPSGKYTTDDWVFNLISARQQQHYSRTFRFVNRQYAFSAGIRCAGAARCKLQA